MQTNGVPKSTRNLITGLALSGLLVLWLVVAALQNPSDARPGLYRARLADVTGLKSGNPVRVRGALRGAVASMRVVDGQAELVLRMDKDLVLTQGTAALVRPKTLLGGRYLEIVPGPADAPVLAANALLATAVQPVSPTELSDFLENALPESSTLFEQAAGTLSLLRDLADDTQRLQALADRASELRLKLNEVSQLATRVGDSLDRLPTSEFDRAAGLADRLERLQQGIARAQEALEQAQAAFDGRLQHKAGLIGASLGRLSSGLEKAEAAQTETLEKLEKALQALLLFDEHFIRRLAQAEGVRALTDPAAKHAVNERIRELESQSGATSEEAGQ
jgi:phospholipid/cholesterol/gamma-HCH transport system substrate-binding protein